MANEQNLHQFRTSDEARENGAKGGRKSGEARRRKRDMREVAKLLLNMQVPVSQKKMRATMDSLGISEDDMTYNVAILVAMLLQAGNGNVKAATFMRDTAGYNPAHQLNEKRFAYQKKRDKEENGGGSGSLADEIEKAYNRRMSREGIDDDEQDESGN